MSDDLIQRLMKESGFHIGIRPQHQLTDMGDGTMRFITPPGLTIHGERMLRFASLVAKECAKACEELDSYQEDDPAKSFADAIRARFNEPGDVMTGETKPQPAATDLVERLRQRAGQYDEYDWHSEIELEAAAEIERLRREIDFSGGMR